MERGIAVIRAACPDCQEFTVRPSTGCCERCGKPLDKRYDYVEIEIAGGDNSKPDDPIRRRKRHTVPTWAERTQCHR